MYRLVWSCFHNLYFSNNKIFLIFQVIEKDFLKTFFIYCGISVCDVEHELKWRASLFFCTLLCEVPSHSK